uniref:C-type lectin domain-containing protein n=1 Tax=Scleropages formosus TaxID=113540 RepID=A0A8C9SA01_SCLFO
MVALGNAFKIFWYCPIHLPVFTTGRVCPQGRNMFNSSCYYISTEKNWTDRQQFCKKKGARLVIVNSKEEQVREKNLTLNTLHPKVDKKNWRDGQPDDYENDDCVESGNTDRDSQKRWNDLSCENEVCWICDKMIVFNFN